MVAACDQGGARRTAQRGGVKTVEAQALRCQPVHRRRWHSTTEGVELAEPRVVYENQHDVRRAFRCFDRLWKLWRIGILVGSPDIAGEVGVRTRQDVGCAWSGSWRYIFCRA